MKHRKAWTMAEIQSIDESATARQHAKRLGRTLHSVIGAAHKYGRRTRHSVKSPEIKARALELHRQGMSCAQVGAQIGVYGSTIYTWVCKARQK